MGLQGKADGNLEYFHECFCSKSGEIKAAAQPWHLCPRAAARPPQLHRIGFSLKCQWGSPTQNWKQECDVFFLFMFNPPPEPEGVGWILKYWRYSNFISREKFLQTFFGRLSYFFPPGLIVWISPTALSHCKAFWGWQMLFKIKFCSSLQYCTSKNNPPITHAIQYGIGPTQAKILLTCIVYILQGNQLSNSHHMNEK